VIEFDIISIGECLVEFFSDRPFVDAESFSKSYGGDAINVLVSASRLGSKTGYITRVGEDHFTPFLLQSWINEKIDLSLVKVIEDRKNGVYFASSFEGGGHNLAYYREESAATTISTDDIKTEYLATGRFFHVSGVGQAISESCREAVFEVSRLVKENRTGEVSYDPHLRSGIFSDRQAEKAFHEVLPYVDILFLEHPFESEVLTGIRDPEELIRALWLQGVRIVVLKQNELGYFAGERHSKIVDAVEPAKDEGSVKEPISGIGVGDAFAGAFLHGLARGYDIFQAIKLGNITAGLKSAGLGAVSSLPSHDDVYRTFEAA